MKKISILSLGALLSLSTNLMAQVSPTGGNQVSGRQGKPATLNLSESTFITEFFKFVARRITKIEIQSQVQEMERDGVKERSFVASFNASGSLVQNYELHGERLSEYDDTGRNVGVQLVPYTIKINEAGNNYITFNAVSLRNMITLQSGENAWKNYGGDVSGFWKVVDNIDFLAFKWDTRNSFDNLETFSIDFAKTDLKFDLLGSTKSTYLAITAGGSLGVGSSKLRLDDGRVISISTSGGSGQSFKSNYHYGVEFMKESKRGSRLLVSAQMSHSYQNGYYLDEAKVAVNQKINETNQKLFQTAKTQYDTDKRAFEQAKIDYEQKNLGGKSISEESFITLSGLKKPVAPKSPEEIRTERDRLERFSMYLTPRIEFSRPVSKPGNRPVRLGMSAEANIPLKDAFEGGINLDMSKHNRNLMNVSLFLNF